MTPEQHARIKELFLQACRRPAGERAAFLDEACAADVELRAHIDELLAQHSEDHAARDATHTRTSVTAPPAADARPAATAPADAGRRLETGTVFAGRYRIVDLLGRGGMGEVYRVEDLQLRQTVALKFLAARYARDVAWLDRFRQEVRLSRAVTHPNVCRVYDIGEAEGEQFISMEYVDGENLKTLLNRIGRLPTDKALQIARQLCAGLAAAHAKGVLHRDLKPANVMLDGRGQVRITDFGLAAVREEIRGPEVLAGTPAYMAPEQLAGKDVSVRSDLYALGLVLYELFTGQPAFQARSFAEYARLKESSRPTPPSRLIENIDPTIERVILSCLEPRPGDRPDSVLAVAAALPGGDLLAAALAAGETPSPEMVAAAGPVRAVDSRWAVAGLAAFIALVAGVVALAPQVHPLCQAPAAVSPQVLAERAREILREVNVAPPADEASGFLDRATWAAGLSSKSGVALPSLDYALPRGNQLVCWYRTSPSSLAPVGPINVLFGGARVTPADPPLTLPGMAGIIFDRTGRLLGLEVVPSLFEPVTGTPPAFDWSALVERAGLDLGTLTPCPAETEPPVAADSRRAWCGTRAGEGAGPIRVEVAERAGRPVFLAVLDASGTASRPREAAALGARGAMVDHGWKLLLAVCVVVALPLARMNLQRGRSDVRGAGRLVAFVYGVQMAAWALQAQHVADFGREIGLLVYALVGGLVQALLLWLLYVALEPYARRYWPHLLVSWARVMRGQVRDRLVGGQLLMGAVLGAGWALLQALEQPLALWLGLNVRSVFRLDQFFTGLSSTRYALAGNVDLLQSAVYQGLSFLLLLVLVRILVRRPALAAVIGMLLMMPLLVPRGSNPLTSWIVLGGGGVGLFVLCLVRFGLLTAVTGLYVAFVLARAPLTFHLGAWYGDLSITSLALTVAIALYGFVAARSAAEPARAAAT